MFGQRQARERDQHRFEVVDRARPFELRDRERFNRVAFAVRLLSLLEPPGLTVVVYERSGSLGFERGRDWSRPSGDWAIVGVPPWASRGQIVLSLLELCGVEPTPLLVASLIERARGSSWS